MGDLSNDHSANESLNRRRFAHCLKIDKLTAEMESKLDLPHRQGEVVQLSHEYHWKNTSGSHIQGL